MTERKVSIKRAKNVINQNPVLKFRRPSCQMMLKLYFYPLSVLRYMKQSTMNNSTMHSDRRNSTRFPNLFRAGMGACITAFAILAIAAAGCNGSDNANNGNATTASHAEPPPPIVPFTVLKSYPHDTTFFTEGLEFHDGKLFEASGSGSDGSDGPSPYPSAFGIVDMGTGKVAIKAELDRNKFFGEGITFFGDKAYQLTYKNGIGYVYDAKTFKKLKEFKLPSAEGWSLTHDTASLIMSDGTDNLYYLDPETMQVKNTIRVFDNNGPVSNVNELEYINGYIYANQWETNYILKIDPTNGKIVGKLDLTSLANEAKSLHPDANYLNGIAYDSSSNRIIVTGKLWPKMYEIRF